jgi:hypothetical protein
MIRARCLLVAWCAALAAMAQQGLPFAGAPMLMQANATKLPSLTGQGFERWFVSGPGIHVGASNSLMNARAIIDLLARSRLSQATVDRVVAGDGAAAFLGAQLTMNALSGGLNLRDASGRTWLALGACIGERQMNAVQLDQRVVDLLYNGNRAYAGRLLQMDPLFVRSLSFGSIGAQAALSFGSRDWRFTTGIGLYRLLPHEGIQLPRSRMGFHTSADGRWVDIASDYRLDVALPDDGQGVLASAGSGTAFDASVGITWRGRLQVHAGVNDIGAVRLQRGAHNYRHTGTTRWEGVDMALSDTYTSPAFAWDSLLSVFDPARSEEAFRMALPSTATGFVQCGLGAPKADKRYAHTVHAQVRAALGEEHFMRHTVAWSIGWTAAPLARLSAGLVCGMPHGDGFAAGVNAAVRMGIVRVGLSSSDAAWILAGRSARSADLAFSVMVGR